MTQTFQDHPDAARHDRLLRMADVWLNLARATHGRRPKRIYAAIGDYATRQAVGCWDTANLIYAEIVDDLRVINREP